MNGTSGEWVVGRYEDAPHRAFIGELGGSICIMDDLPLDQVARVTALHNRVVEMKQARIEALEKWGEDAERTLVYASTILGSYAKDGNPAELAEGECDRVFTDWATLVGDKEGPRHERWDEGLEVAWAKWEIDGLRMYAPVEYAPAKGSFVAGWKAAQALEETMTEPTPEGLRLEAEVERCAGHRAQASAIDDYASAWEADRKAASEMAVERQDLLARIEALDDDVRSLECALQDAIEGRAGWDLAAKAMVHPINRMMDRMRRAGATPEECKAAFDAALAAKEKKT
jgi:hypothetical protein